MSNTLRIVIIVMVSFLLSTVVSLWSLTILSRDHIQDINTMIAARVYLAIDRSLQEPVTVANTMANDSFLIEALRNEEEASESDDVSRISKYLSDLKIGLDYDAAFVVSENTKRYYTFDGLSRVIDPENDEYDKWYTRFVDSDAKYEVNINRDDMHEDVWTAFANARIENGGRLYGVCGVGVEMKDLQDLFRSYESEYNVRISVVDSEGKVRIDTDENSIGKEYFDTDVIGDKSDDYVYNHKGSDEFIVTRYIENLGWYLVVSSNGSDTGMRFLKVILLNIALCLLVLTVIAITMRVSVKRVKELHSASMIDSLTQMHNRRAYEDEKERLSAVDLPDDLICMTADVNGLKEVNDNIGHEAGDELIKGAADCLKECFEGLGTVYRIGGDEFAAILYAGSEELEEAKKRLSAVLDNWEGEKCGRLAVSCGYASKKEFPSAGINELTGISDERMYAEKREYYKTHDRRHR